MFAHPPTPLKALKASFLIQLLILEVTPRQAHAHGQGQRASFPQGIWLPLQWSMGTPASPSQGRRETLECWAFTHCHVIVPSGSRSRNSLHMQIVPREDNELTQGHTVAGLRLEHQYRGFPSRTYILISWGHHHYTTKGLIVSLESWFFLLKYRHHLSTIF